ncbi:hypothetical protein MMC13_007118 [Lambiella insularis]|nr:hypothetical protein [Lambiella insularis]
MSWDKSTNPNNPFATSKPKVHKHAQEIFQHWGLDIASAGPPASEFRFRQTEPVAEGITQELAQLAKATTGCGVAVVNALLAASLARRAQPLVPGQTSAQSSSVNRRDIKDFKANLHFNNYAAGNYAPLPLPVGPALQPPAIQVQAQAQMQGAPVQVPPPQTLSQVAGMQQLTQATHQTQVATTHSATMQAAQPTQQTLHPIPVTPEGPVVDLVAQHSTGRSS